MLFILLTTKWKINTKNIVDKGLINNILVSLLLLIIQTTLLVNIKRKSIKNIYYLTKMSYKQKIVYYFFTTKFPILYQIKIIILCKVHFQLLILEIIVIQTIYNHKIEK